MITSTTGQNNLPSRQRERKWIITILCLIWPILYNGKSGPNFINAPWWNTCVLFLSLSCAAWTVIKAVSYFRDYADKVKISAWGKWSIILFLLPLFSSCFFWIYFTTTSDVFTRITGTPFSIVASHTKEARPPARGATYYTISAGDRLTFQLPNRIRINSRPWGHYKYESLPNAIPVTLKGKKSVFGFHFQHTFLQP
jgi:hypothetical protein